MTKSIGGASKNFLSLAWCLISKSSAPGVTGHFRMDMYKVTPTFSRGVGLGVWPYPNAVGDRRGLTTPLLISPNMDHFRCRLVQVILLLGSA